jgi:hypothetical protein
MSLLSGFKSKAFVPLMTTIKRRAGGGPAWTNTKKVFEEYAKVAQENGAEFAKAKEKLGLPEKLQYTKQNIVNAHVNPGAPPRQLVVSPLEPMGIIAAVWWFYLAYEDWDCITVS